VRRVHVQHFCNLGNLTVFREAGADVLAGFFYLYELVGTVERKADHPAFLADGLEDGLANPPDGVADKVVSLVYIIALDGVDEPDVAFADQVR